MEFCGGCEIVGYAMTALCLGAICYRSYGAAARYTPRWCRITESAVVGAGWPLFLPVMAAAWAWHCILGDGMPLD